VNDPTGRARGHPARSIPGSFTPRLVSITDAVAHRRAAHTAARERDDDARKQLRNCGLRSRGNQGEEIDAVA